MNLIKIFQSFFVLLLFLPLLSYETFAEQSTPIKLAPTDDAHVLADLSDPQDIRGLMQSNAGNVDSIQLISSWNVTEINSAIVTIGYLKFDVSQQKTYNLEKAELKMLAREVILDETPKTVALLHVANNNWKESDITYLKRPTYSTTIASSAEITTPNTWYSWDVTDLVKQNPGSELSVALTFQTGKDNTEDIVSFYSKEFTNNENAPYIALYYTTDSTVDLSGDDSNLFTAIIISGLVGAAAASFITKLFVSKNKDKPSKTDIKQASKTPEKIQCKNCGSILPQKFKFCPFCSTQVNQ